MARGDRLAVPRWLSATGVPYTHHGIDLGDGTVVHAQPHDPARLFAGGCVVRTSLGDFAAGAPVRHVTEPAAAFPAEEVARRAEAAVGRDGYCPVGDNCEHFASWCATGAPHSRQTAILRDRAGAVAARLATILSARLATVAGERLVVRTALGTTARLGLRTLVPAALVAEGAALAVEWTAHQRGAAREHCRMLGETAGLATSAGVCAAAALGAGPVAVVTAALAGAAVWAGGSVAVGVAGRSPRRTTRAPVDRATGAATVGQ
ncbi:MAG: hypothetical protein EBR86_11310 [Planctomycetia bacterium]|nr:hypothetical protein [Planctomycetia bacterium]